MLSQDRQNADLDRFVLGEKFRLSALKITFIIINSFDWPVVNIEHFECGKTKTKAVTLANHNR